MSVAKRAAGFFVAVTAAACGSDTSPRPIAEAGEHAPSSAIDDGGDGASPAPSASSTSPSIDGDDDAQPHPIADGGDLALDVQLEAADPVGDEGMSLPPEANGHIRGTVVDFVTHRPLAGRKVSVADQTAISDASGQFAVAAPAGAYDVTVVDPDGSTISIYRGVARRNPILAHHRSSSSDRAAQTATISGHLTGAGPYPLAPSDSTAVYAFSQQSDSYDLLGGGLSEPFLGPDFGPLRLSWNATSPLAARVIALGISHRPEQGGYSAFLGDQSVSLAPGDMASIDLALMPVAQVHVGGTIDAPTGSSIVEKQVFYRLPLVHAVIPLGSEPSSSVSFDYMIADLGNIGEICLGAAGSPGFFVTQRCGILPGTTDARITLQPSPQLSSPADGSSATNRTSFAWSDFDGGVYSLALEASGANGQTPSIYLLTTEKAASWPDLTAIGVPFPRGASYQCTIGGVGPFASIDEAVGPTGLGDPFPREARRSYAQSIYLTTVR